MCARARRGAPSCPLTCGGGYCEPEKETQSRLHEPRSSTGAPGLEDGRLWPRKGARAGHRWPRLPAAGLAGWPLELRPGVGCGGHKLESALPIPAQGGRLWLGLFWLPHHLSPPRLPEGLELALGPLNPGRTGGRLPARGSRPGARGPRRTQQGEGWGGAERGQQRRPRAHPHSAYIHMHTHARSHSEPAHCCPRTAALAPRAGQR